MRRTGYPSACADSGLSPTARRTNPARVRWSIQASAIVPAMVR